MSDKAEWLEECVPWNGKESSLPTGALMPPAIDVFKLIKSWTILDAESDEGFRVVRTRELQPEDTIIGAEANNGSIRAILKTYGADAFRFTDTQGTQLSPEAWASRMHTNPFALLAVTRKLMGPRGAFKIP